MGGDLYCSCRAYGCPHPRRRWHSSISSVSSIRSSSGSSAGVITGGTPSDTGAWGLHGGYSTARAYRYHHSWRRLYELKRRRPHRRTSGGGGVSCTDAGKHGRGGFLLFLLRLRLPLRPAPVARVAAPASSPAAPPQIPKHAGKWVEGRRGGERGRG